jgi:hypothetical protein
MNELELNTNKKGQNMPKKTILNPEVRLAVNFIQQQVRTIGLGYHIDNDYSDYINTDTKQPLYNRSEVAELNSALDAAINICDKYDIDYYSVALAEMTKLEKI